MPLLMTLKGLQNGFASQSKLKSWVTLFLNGHGPLKNLNAMIINLVTKSFFTPSYQMETKFTRLIPNKGVVGDSLSVSKSSFEEFDFVEYASQFRSSDFDIQSLLAVGAYDMLKPTYISNLSDMNFADKFQGLTITKPD